MLTIDAAARITAIIVAIGILQSSLQLFSMYREFCSSGLFDWNTRRLRNGPSGTSRRWFIGQSGERWLLGALIVRIVFSLALVIPFQTNLLYGSYALGIVLTSLFLAYQIRYGKDGSNQISVIVLAGLAFVFLLPESSPFRPVGLYFIAAQAVFSYFAAGISKLLSARWRDGSALQTILNTATYGQRTVAAVLDRRPWVGRFVGWSVISIEIVFPVALISPAWLLIALLCAGALLHIGTVLLIGLDTFFWAFTATFPAIIFVHGALLGG